MVTRVVHDGKRKVNNQRQRCCGLFTPPKILTPNETRSFSKPKAQGFYFFNVLARKLTVLFHASAASLAR
jgi:hypothetical protein